MFSPACCPHRLGRRTRIRKHPFQSCSQVREQDMATSGGITYASRVALLSHEGVFMTDDSPEAEASINSCHLSASCGESSLITPPD
jgi:hypothetical protein